MPDTTTEPDVSNLSAEVIDACTRQYDFYSDDKTPESWEVAFVRDDDELNAGQYDPMINTLWPLPDTFEVPDDPRPHLDNMTIVYVGVDYGPRYFLALTGGGMDFSNEIAATYVSLGYLPPSCLGKLPGGLWDGHPHRDLLRAALKRSHELMIQRLQANIRDLDALGGD